MLEVPSSMRAFFPLAITQWRSKLRELFRMSSPFRRSATNWSRTPIRRAAAERRRWTARPRPTGVSRPSSRLFSPAKANRLVIRHQSEDLVVAILEIVSPGNKSSQKAIDQFVQKAATARLGGRTSLGH